MVKTIEKPRRKSSRVAEIVKTKEATEFLEAVIDMHQKELTEVTNKKIIADKNIEAVFPLNNKTFVEKPFPIIKPNLSSPGSFDTAIISFLDFLNWENKDKGAPYPTIVPPPDSTGGIRKAFDDFNDILQKDQRFKGEAVTLVTSTSNICKLNKSKDPPIEAARSGKRELQKFYQHMCFYCGRQIEVKYPGAVYPELLNTQCDHIFPIASALISLKRNANLIYNFQSVHKTCNSKASAMSISTIWETIGTDIFTSLNRSRQWCTFLLDGNLTTTELNTQEWCRGYLAQLLNKLTIVNYEEQIVRRQIFERVIRTYALYKEEVRLLMEDNVAEGVGYLKLLSAGDSQAFGTPNNNIQLLSIKKLKGDKKKYEAFFLVNGTKKSQKFGAEGMSDYTIHKDVERRNRYIARHFKDLETSDPTRAGYLSMFILWNDPTFKTSVNDYRTRLSIYNKTGKFPISIPGYPNKNKFCVNQVTQLARYKPVVLPGDISVNEFGTPTNVVNKKLYETIKAKIRDTIKGRRWGAYDSGRLVKTYKESGGKYTGDKKDNPLSRWYEEKWVNACKWPQVVPCGRSDMKNKMAYCRPSVKVNKNTPQTVQSLTSAQIYKRCKIKQETPLVRITDKIK